MDKTESKTMIQNRNLYNLVVNRQQKLAIKKKKNKSTNSAAELSFFIRIWQPYLNTKVAVIPQQASSINLAAQFRTSLCWSIWFLFWLQEVLHVSRALSCRPSLLVFISLVGLYNLFHKDIYYCQDNQLSSEYRVLSLKIWQITKNKIILC